MATDDQDYSSGVRRYIIHKGRTPPQGEGGGGRGMKCIFNMCDFRREEEYIGPYPPRRWKFAIPPDFSIAMSEAAGVTIPSHLEFELETYDAKAGVAYYWWKRRGR